MSGSTASRLYPVAAFLLVAAGVAAVCLRVLSPFLTAIAWAIVLAVAFHAPYRWLERRLKGRSDLAAAAASLAIALVVLLPAGLFLAALATQAAEVAQGVAQRARASEVSSLTAITTHPAVESVLSFVQHRTGWSRPELNRKAAELVAQASGFLAQKSGSLILGLFDAVLTFAMTIFLLFFFLRDGREMASAVTELLPLDAAARERQVASLGSMLRAIFRGSFLAALTQGVTGGVGWAIAGLPSPVLAGAATSFVALLPIGGSALVWLPGAVALWLTGRPGMAIFLVVWGVVVVSFLADNVLKPILIGGASELGTLTVFLGVFGGLGAFGLLGLFIGPMALALAATLVGVLREMGKTSAAEPAT